MNVPWMLLVEGDIIELRAGQIAPCRCISQQGRSIDLGDTAQYPQVTCPETHGVCFFARFFSCSYNMLTGGFYKSAKDYPFSFLSYSQITVKKR